MNCAWKPYPDLDKARTAEAFSSVFKNFLPRVVTCLNYRFVNIIFFSIYRELSQRHCRTGISRETTQEML